MSDRRSASSRPDSPLFVVPLQDLERSDRQLSWPIPAPWLRQQLQGTEVLSADEAGQLELYLKKSGNEVLVKGHARARVTVPCARTLAPVSADLDAPIFLMLRPAVGSPQTSGEANRRAQSNRNRADKSRESAARAGGSGSASSSAETALSAEDAAFDVYQGNTLELDGFVREHLILELPLFPVRTDLRSAQSNGNHPRSGGEPEGSEAGVDPRLAPLAALARQLRQTTKE